MNAEQQRLEPAFDFTTSESSIPLHQGKAEICLDEKVYSAWVVVFRDGDFSNL